MTVTLKQILRDPLLRGKPPCTIVLANTEAETKSPDLYLKAGEVLRLADSRGFRTKLNAASNHLSISFL